MREKPEYRDNMEALLAFSGGKMLLSATEVAKYCGCDRRTAVKRYAISKDGITVPTLARRMCE